ncbi:hypothetical protein [Actinomadura sp. BRA 177]|uniref:hypothetical protein n=1 Tax=Actinomadura sp. BRA 177 TaxID=2745202 RepID=UPI001594E76E|nr:hypothetical protein [Actinomadura sp. BRA 177]NVI91186.1 hypothetical protein [Actinomadura sp. BRA 177]
MNEASPSALDIGELAAEFPGWTIELVQDSPLWRASRDMAPPLAIAANSLAELRALLDEADRLDCRRTTNALAVLREYGVIAQPCGQAVVAEPPGGVRRTIVAGRGLYEWTSGVLIGLVGDVSEAAERVLRGLRES